MVQFPEFTPQTAQIPFLTTEADIAVYGGAAGGGKSWALLYDPIQYIDQPGFNGVIFRRTHPEIVNAGGLWDEASGIYPYCCGTPYVGATEYRFPWNTKIAFRHLQHEEDKHSWQGAQICYLGFDELTHFTESQFWYLLSRNRSVCGVRPYVRATCNPDPGWVKSLLAPWVDTEFSGLRATSGELRWFIRDGGEIRWVDRVTADAKSLTFIRASVYDNPALLSKNPEYVATLKALPPVERARLLDGDWNVRREGLVYPGFQSCIVEAGPNGAGSNGVPSVGGIDFGFHNPFAANWGHLDHDDVLWITGGRYKRQTTLPIHSEALPKGVEWWCDPSGAESIRQLLEAGHSVHACVHMPRRGAGGEKQSSKLAGIDQVSERMRSGRLKIVRCQETMPLIRELGMYHYDETKQVEEPVDEDNHACDALRYLIVGTDRGRSMPYVYPLKMAAELIAEEKALALADLDRRKAEDLAAQQNPDLDRWWNA
jgi:hypothetical protein